MRNVSPAERFRLQGPVHYGGNVPEATVEAILQARERSLEEGADLLEWAENIRSGPTVRRPA